jgi:hypothetical protein
LLRRSVGGSLSFVFLEALTQLPLMARFTVAMAIILVVPARLLLS